MTAEIGPCSPFLIVSDLPKALKFYVDILDFEIRFQETSAQPFFAIVGLGTAQILLKDVGVVPVPNPVRHADARWDIFIYTQDPDALAASIEAHGATLLTPPDDTQDGLRGFEIADPDGHVLFFGHPRG